MSRWFRHYAGMMRDEKLVRAALMSKQPIERVVWVWGAILESAAEINDGGRFSIDYAEMAYFLRSEYSELEAIGAALGAIGRIEDGCVTKWKERQFESDCSTKRVQRHRETLRNVSETECNAPETETETETENIEQKEKKDRPKREARLRTPYPEDFVNEFWKPYPTSPNMSKSEALAAWRGLSEEERKLASAAVPAFKNWLREQKDHPVVHACRFLKQRRFEGFTAHGPPQSSQLKDELEIIRRQIAEAGNGKTDGAGGGRVGADNIEELRPARAIAR